MVPSATNGLLFRTMRPRGVRSRKRYPPKSRSQHPFGHSAAGTRGVPLIKVICAPPLCHSSSRLAGRRSPRHARGGGGGDRMPAPRLHPVELYAALLLGGAWTAAVAALIFGLELWRTALQSGGMGIRTAVNDGGCADAHRAGGSGRLMRGSSDGAVSTSRPPGRGGTKLSPVDPQGSASRPERARSCRLRPEERRADPAPG
jgi:hypothetical protein